MSPETVLVITVILVAFAAFAVALAWASHVAPGSPQHQGTDVPSSPVH